MGHNGPTDEIITGELKRIQDAWRLKEEAKQAYQGENARYRRCIKDAKAKGLNADAINDLIRDWEKDPDDNKQRIIDRLRYSALLGMPIGSQGEIFETAAYGNPADLGKAKVAGRKQTGRKSLDKANPYPKGSWQAKEFERGWVEGAEAARSN
jgi:hypothetical protein